MTMYSKTELATHSLQKAGLLGADESLTAADLSFATKVIDSRVAYLPSESVSIPNGSAEAVPIEWLDPLADYMGLYLTSAFGGPAPTKGQMDAALTPLRALTAISAPPTGLRLQPDYF